jgi:hypothetical protein
MAAPEANRIIQVLYALAQMCVAAAWVLDPRLLAARGVPWGGVLLLAGGAVLVLTGNRMARWGILAVAAYMAAYAAMALSFGGDVASDVPGAYGRKVLWLVGIELLQLYGWMASPRLPASRR